MTVLNSKSSSGYPKRLQAKLRMVSILLPDIDYLTPLFYEFEHIALSNSIVLCMIKKNSFEKQVGNEHFCQGNQDLQ